MFKDNIKAECLAYGFTIEEHEKRLIKALKHYEGKVIHDLSIEVGEEHRSYLVSLKTKNKIHRVCLEYDINTYVATMLWEASAPNIPEIDIEILDGNKTMDKAYGIVRLNRVMYRFPMDIYKNNKEDFTEFREEFYYYLMRVDELFRLVFENNY